GITITGTSTPGTESINLYADGTQVNLPITPDAQTGDWTVTLTVPDDINQGEHTFTATAVNNNVESGLSNEVTFTISCAPTIDAHDDDTDCTDGITITGTSTPGTESINLYADGTQVNLPITPDAQTGDWTVTLTVPDDINQGEHTFTATAVNNNVESGLSNEVTFTISCAPTITQPPITIIDCTIDFAVSGTSEPGNEAINLYKKDAQNQLTFLGSDNTIDQNGDWSVILNPTDPNLGEGTFTLVAKAVNNNVESAESNEVTLTINCPLVAPAINGPEL